MEEDARRFKVAPVERHSLDESHTVTSAHGEGGCPYRVMLVPWLSAAYACAGHTAPRAGAVFRGCQCLCREDCTWLCCPGHLEAASNAETSLTQIVQQFTIRAQVTLSRVSR